MKKTKKRVQMKTIVFYLLTVLIITNFTDLSACSTFMLKKGEKLISGHNLNEGDLDVPGMIYINRRAIFKKGRTLEELTTKDKDNPSSFNWISRYGSVTFNILSKDLPDGGMNEEGLYIWEMNEDANFPKDDDLPKLNMMSWIQFALDTYIGSFLFISPRVTLLR